ncbi:MAG: MarR family winged helix-turn-helix transcriptional regulator [Solirubrobacterales bacterium]
MRDDWQIHGDERSLPALLGEVKELAIDELHGRLGDEGYPDIRPGHGCVFRFIEPGGSRLTQIATRAGMTKQAVGEVVADLERLGYVERVPDPNDRRAKIIRLSERGWDAERVALGILADIERRWAREVGEQRVAELRETIEAVLAAEQAPV